MRNRTDMKKLHFEVSIQASAEHVYNSLIGDQTYSEWTSVFNPTSKFEGSWKKGEKILFIGTDKEGNVGGMVSRIKDNVPNKFISIEHYGAIEKGVEITSGPKVDPWAGALENYTITEAGGKSVLSVDIDSNEEWTSYFNELFPKALDKLKSICER